MYGGVHTKIILRESEREMSKFIPLLFCRPFDLVHHRGVHCCLGRDHHRPVNPALSPTRGSDWRTALESSQEVRETHLPPTSRFELRTSTPLLRGVHDHFHHAYCHLQSLAKLSNRRSSTIMTYTIICLTVLETSLTARSLNPARPALFPCVLLSLPVGS
ncbi:hypothetical protein GQ457_08G032940 [Hibiscus cannabinus]